MALTMNVDSNMPTSPFISKRLVVWCSVFIVTACGAGLIRKAPGTWGSIFAGIVVLLWEYLSPGITDSTLWIVITLATTIIGIICTRHLLQLAYFGAGKYDPSQVVIDEVVGIFISVYAVYDYQQPWMIIFPFLLFRFFDIIKPPPVSTAERLPGALGVMTDDIVAGLLANLSCHGLLLLIY